MDWEKFIKESEAVAPEEPAIKAVAEFFRDQLGCASPGSLEGYSEANVITKGLGNPDAPTSRPSCARLTLALQRLAHQWPVGTSGGINAGHAWLLQVRRQLKP